MTKSLDLEIRGEKYLYLHFCDFFVFDVPGQKDI